MSLVRLLEIRDQIKDNGPEQELLEEFAALAPSVATEISEVLRSHIRVLGTAADFQTLIASTDTEEFGEQKGVFESAMREKLLHHTFVLGDEEKDGEVIAEIMSEKAMEAADLISELYELEASHPEFGTMVVENLVAELDVHVGAEDKKSEPESTPPSPSALRASELINVDLDGEFELARLVNNPSSVGDLHELSLSRPEEVKEFLRKLTPEAKADLLAASLDAGSTTGVHLFSPFFVAGVIERHSEVDLIGALHILVEEAEEALAKGDKESLARVLAVFAASSWDSVRKLQEYAPGDAEESDDLDAVAVAQFMDSYAVEIEDIYQEIKKGRGKRRSSRVAPGTTAKVSVQTEESPDPVTAAAMKHAEEVISRAAGAFTEVDID